MTGAPRRGSTFIFSQAGVGEHLFIIISDPVLNADQIVAVSITTLTPSKDRTCVLEVGDHEFVRHRSCIAYNKAMIFREPYFSPIFNRSRKCTDVAEPLLSRIIDGALASDDTPVDIQDFLMNQLGR